MRDGLVILLALHGIAHLVGFIVPFRIIPNADLAYRETILGGRVRVGGRGARILGIVWLVLAVGFLVAAGAVYLQAGWALPLTLAVAVASLLMTIPELPEATIGLLVDAVLVVLILGTSFVDWL